MSEHEVKLTSEEWERITVASFRGGAKAWKAEIEAIIAARLADAEARAEAAEAKVARVADLAVRWDDTDLGTDRYCAQELREALRGDQ